MQIYSRTHTHTNINIQYVSILRPPSQPSDDVDFKTEWKQVIDILWSDPIMSDSVSPTPNKRGAGECFGPETTNKFLQRHNLTTLVRSHECKSDGYEIVHNGNVRIFTYERVLFFLT